MAFGSGKKESERYCYNCMAILPTKIVTQTLHDFETFHEVKRTWDICIRCNKRIKPPEEEQDDKTTRS